MRVYFVGSRDRIDEELMRVDRGSLLLMGYGVDIEIDLVQELDGDSDVLRRMADYTRRMDLVLVAGIHAQIYRRRYLSAVVIDRGHIIGISDETHSVGEAVNLGSTYRVYDTSLGMVGLAVGVDAFFPEVARLLTTHNSDYIIALAGEIMLDKAKSALRTHAFLNGRTILSLVGRDALVVDSEGVVLAEKEAKMCHIDIDITRNDLFINALRPNIYENVYIEK